MKKLLGALALITMFAVAFITFQSWTPPPPPPPPAGFSNMWSQAFTLDTLTNTETVNYEFEKKFDYASDIAWQVNDIEISGTATNLVLVQQTACATCTDWITTDTLASITATGNQTIHLTHDPEYSTQNLLWGYRCRLRMSNSGTGVHSVKIYALARRNE
jgi:hypothetical protein